MEFSQKQLRDMLVKYKKEYVPKNGTVFVKEEDISQAMNDFMAQSNRSSKEQKEKNSLKRQLQTLIDNTIYENISMLLTSDDSSKKFSAQFLLQEINRIIESTRNIYLLNREHPSTLVNPIFTPLDLEKLVSFTTPKGKVYALSAQALELAKVPLEVVEKANQIIAGGIRDSINKEQLLADLVTKLDNQLNYKVSFSYRDILRLKIEREFEESKENLST